ncbi:LacI family DNA-binding transcriptional regulator [Actinotalea sp.]|uniref:LacI family DNA-binding transcriptional regulator n=1 Tax=Actinotalea sp. TaxID=1872145 RepID=UPI003562D33A
MAGDTTQREARPGRTRATLQDIAAEAGVSVPTVSKVVKGRSDVAPATRARIQALLDEHGYTPRNRASARTPTPTPRVVELCFDTMDSTNNLATMRGVLGLADREGVEVVVKIAPHTKGPAWADEVVSAHHAGVILVTSLLDEAQQERFAEARVPVVVIDPVNVPTDSIPSVGVNNFTGGYLATKHLLELGHRRIAMIQGIASECAQARFAGYHAALREHGVVPPDAYDERGEFRFEQGRQAALRLLDLGEPPTAIFAANDLEALGVLDAARTRGVRVPEDLSLVGFDDALQATSASPRLTTVRQPFSEIGSTALQVLLQLANDVPLATNRLELSTQLIVRESTAAPPS